MPHYTKAAEAIREIRVDCTVVEMIKTIAIIALAVVAGCDKQPPAAQRGTSLPTTQTKPAPEWKEPNSIGPQFWVYDLSSYSIADNDVVSGISGRWISVRYRRKSSADISRQDLVANITSSLESDGWTKKPLPSGKYMLSQIWEKSGQDLQFTRGAKDHEPAHWFFSQTIHISSDASVICLYCEVGW